MEIKTTYRQLFIAGSVAISAALGFYAAGAQLVPLADTALRTVFTPIPVLWASAGLIAALTPLVTGVAGGLVARKLCSQRPKPATEAREQNTTDFGSLTVGTAA